MIRKLQEIKVDWNAVLKQISSLISTPRDAFKAQGWEMNKVEIGLAFNAKGRLAFIAEAGLEASIKLTIERAEAA